PNTTTLSSVNYIATCVAKPIINTPAALAIANNNRLFFNPDNFSELLIIDYLYSNNSAFDIKERLMKNLKIIGVQKQNLYSTKDYLNALEMITSIESLQQYLQENVLTVIADWPGQYFI
ncbi:26285_t:CDS:2, partial [Dentiscutata erythropus]